KNYVIQYGDINIKIKRESAMKKATITFRDSLGSESTIAATPAAKPHFTTFDGTLKKLREVSKYKPGKSPSYTYVEAQYHNQLTIDDIESVYIPYGHFDSDEWDKINEVINSIQSFSAKHGRDDIKIKIF
ncbi:MAG: hypothetical protein Q8T08_16765, partial [Ignavibacteria bacterium]|nr:hypothetical protein [Ignavibacteria bacterium]